MRAGGEGTEPPLILSGKLLAASEDWPLEKTPFDQEVHGRKCLNFMLSTIRTFLNAWKYEVQREALDDLFL